MFASLVPIGHPVTIHFDGRPIPARLGETVAASLLRAAEPAFRKTPVSGMARLPYCMIGHCFDCLVEIEGQGTRQACLVSVTDGLRIGLQSGMTAVAGGE
jgi:D-hydroxyproline dehydrogenase subunit gamma